jgi:hypothetical protein
MAGKKRFPYQYRSSLTHLQIICAQIRMSRKKYYKKTFFPGVRNNSKYVLKNIFSDVPQKKGRYFLKALLRSAIKSSTSSIPTASLKSVSVMPNS